MELDKELIELLAQAIHERYRSRQASTRTVIPQWHDLDEDKRRASRNQAQDISRKLASIGCVIRPGPASGFAFTEEQTERLARDEHLRWCAERRTAGWTHAVVRDDRAKHHPSLIPWEQLSQAEQDKDRDAVLDIPVVLAKAGLDIAREP